MPTFVDSLLPLLVPLLFVVGAFRALRWMARPRQAVAPVVVVVAAGDRVPVLAGDGLPRDPHERFAVMAEIHGRTADDLAAQERRTWWSFATCFNGTVVLLALGTVVGGFYGLLCVMWAISMGALTLRAAFEHWQLRSRSLAGLAVFLARPGEWWPPSPYQGAEEPPARRLTAADVWFVVRQLPRRLWCALRGHQVPPAPAGTPRLSYEPPSPPLFQNGGRRHG